MRRLGWAPNIFYQHKNIYLYDYTIIYHTYAISQVFTLRLLGVFKMLRKKMVEKCNMTWDKKEAVVAYGKEKKVEFFVLLKNLIENGKRKTSIYEVELVVLLNFILVYKMQLTRFTDVSFTSTYDDDDDACFKCARVCFAWLGCLHVCVVVDMSVLPTIESCFACIFPFLALQPTQ